ncbi:hypothetical protein L7F22_040434 [Adiantum nelumboides]|nr:hypothetical protein [Adiantum nelumboides]
MDFIFGLPKSIHGNTGIWTIVDRLSKQAHFIPIKKTIKAHQMATLFISQIFKYHGLPTSIVSDRDPRMTCNFWKGLFENRGTRLNFSLAYHPQTDGQSEIANLTILDLLKSYVMEVDQRSQWEMYLPLVEYAFNNILHTSTGKAPFEVIEGRSKSPLLLKVHGKIFAADEYSRDLKESFQKIKEAISISQQKQKAAANKHRRALAFKENDWVLLKFPKARLRHTSGKNPTGHQKYYAKLAKRYYGPFQILKPINKMAYQLKLPNYWLIHNAFHVSLLKPYKGEPPSEAIMEDPPEVEDQEEVLQPESILRHEDKVLRYGFLVNFWLETAELVSFRFKTGLLVSNSGSGLSLVQIQQIWFTGLASCPDLSLVQIQDWFISGSDSGLVSLWSGSLVSFRTGLSLVQIQDWSVSGLVHWLVSGQDWLVSGYKNIQRKLVLKYRSGSGSVSGSDSGLVSLWSGSLVSFRTGLASL